jgi:release factor glutamine methyltransferase
MNSLQQKILTILSTPVNMPSWDIDAMIKDAQLEADAIISVASESTTDVVSVEVIAIEMAKRRANGELLGIILKRIEFMGLQLETSTACLVPRKETELLARTAIEVLSTSNIANPIVIDMCCGAGNIACAIAHYVPNVTVIACDLTLSCIELGRRNATRLGLGDRLSFFQGDLFNAIQHLNLIDKVDGIFCNPPYISSGKLSTDRASLLANEPQEAFDGGPYGLTIHQRVLSESPQYLKEGGWLAFEFGVGQERQLSILFQRLKQFYTQTEIKYNDEGVPRAIISTKKLQENQNGS